MERRASARNTVRILGPRRGIVPVFPGRASVFRLTRAITALEAELGPMVAALAPGLLAERGCGTLTAATLIGAIAGIGRFATDAKLARAAAAAPIPASSGRTDRHRLDRGGNRQLNCALHRLAVSKGPPRSRDRCLPRARAGRRQDPPRSAALPQASPRPPGLATSATARGDAVQRDRQPAAGDF